MTYCIDCNKPKKSNKSKRCHSCARIKQHESGVFNNKKLDRTNTHKYCSFCSKDHEIDFEGSNDFWLARKNTRDGGLRHECRKHRKSLYIKSRLKPQNRLRKSVSNLVRNCISKHKATKNSKLINCVNWTIEELKQQLESQFQPGMTWDNYGEWHIDHKIPDSWFYYSSIEDEGFKKSWSLENLQPKWAKDNISKGNRYSD